MHRRMPIRWRLTLWYALLLALALGVFGTALYVGLRIKLYDSFDDQLRTQASILLPSIRTQGDQLVMTADTAAMPNDGEHLVRLLDLAGHPVPGADTSQTMGGVPLDAHALAAAKAGKTDVSTLQLEDGELRVLTVPVSSQERIVGVLQVGLFRNDVNETLSTLLVLFGIVSPLVLIGAVAGGYLLARRALAPVATITNLAATVGGKDLHARLDLALPDDELGRLAQTFDSMLARIESAFMRQRRFTGDAAHELRTPLSLMRSQIDLALARPRSAAEYRAALHDLESDLARLTGLVATLLTLARADSDQLAIERARFDLADTVALVLDQYAAAASEAGVSLKDEATPCALDGDEDRLVQVLVNLLDNALAHTPANGVIAVGCRRDGDTILLWVADTGSGIAAAEQSRVFDRFYRGSVDRGSGHGSGLGLSIVRAIVDAHGGTAALTSELGQGTRIEIRLPTKP